MVKKKKEEIDYKEIKVTDEIDYILKTENCEGCDYWDNVTPDGCGQGFKDIQTCNDTRPPTEEQAKKLLEEE